MENLLGKTLEEVEILAVQELGVCKDDMYFDIINDIRDTLNNDELYFEFDFSLLYNDMFRNVIKYEK